ncbi:MAG: FkbM family methyltransferase [Melioribacteraceae bacterium]|nr:FkbM family methyltransferase [Melioribacteraceae bacterium]MCF8356489.1 FkbM family methyltransferase [Melioribacteraceae bacterium]MCF8394858.1 FkbM family methyltransferase [Melioribacteraceae bacterium]MCF8420586.1 FkbM family methyltransferase [Melioribacteraceae bacterium]
MRGIKNIVYNSKLYQCYQDQKEIKRNHKWSSTDDKMLKFYSSFIKSDDLVFDVGANSGNRSKIFLKLNARVIAIEPQKRCVNILDKSFGKNSNINIVSKGLSSLPGKASIRIGDFHTVSSLSEEWINSVRASGRFGDLSWNKTEEIELTTLDNLIKEYGVPGFIKIDVEGYELEVLKGLSQPVGCISIEFIPERLEQSFRCIDYLSKLGSAEFNYSLNESMVLDLKVWTSSSELKNILAKFKGDAVNFGVIYIRFV